MSLTSHSFFIGNAGSQGSAIPNLDYYPQTHSGSAFNGYGELIANPSGSLDLPKGFQYKEFSQQGDSMSDGNPVPKSHYGIGAFTFRRGRIILIRNHELEHGNSIGCNLQDVTSLFDTQYDPHPAATGGTTNLIMGHRGRLISDYISLSGILNNSSGVNTPWQSWLSCEKDTTYFDKPHGYVFEISPLSNGNPSPIYDMGRFNHHAICFDRQGIVYQSEIANDGFGCFYRYLPISPFGGLSSLHCGGKLQAMSVKGFGCEFSKAHTPGTVLEVTWLDIENPNPKLESGESSVKEQAENNGATLVNKCNSAWTDSNGNIWFVSKTQNASFMQRRQNIASQIWKYDPIMQTIELIAVLEAENSQTSNIALSPFGFAVACNNEKNQTMVGITEQGQTFPLGKNNKDEEFAGSAFSSDGRTLFVNIKGSQGKAFAITGPWK